VIVRELSRFFGKNAGEAQPQPTDALAVVPAAPPLALPTIRDQDKTPTFLRLLAVIAEQNQRLANQAQRLANQAQRLANQDQRLAACE
jgi:hypothetical protein